MGNNTMIHNQILSKISRFPIERLGIVIMNAFFVISALLAVTCYAAPGPVIVKTEPDDWPFHGFPIPVVYASELPGICPSQPHLPCCARLIRGLRLEKMRMMDVSLANCRPDGYFEPKQCQWFGCHCVDLFGNRVDAIYPSDALSHMRDYDIEFPRAKP